jgi:hypothetical protein
MRLGSPQDCTRLHARAWSQEELDTLGEALDDVVQRLGDGFSYKEVEAKFSTHLPNTSHPQNAMQLRCSLHALAALLPCSCRVAAMPHWQVVLGSCE